VDVGHTQALTGHLDFLADTLRRMGEEIEERGNEVSDMLSDKAATAGQEASHG
jgi:hypothetical protein